MHTFKIAGTTWFLDDPSLERVVEQLGHEPGGKRVHFISEYPGGKVFIKFFYEKGLPGLIRNRILPRGKKEYELSKKLQSLSVLTPKALGYGVAPRGSYVIQEWIDGEPLLSWAHEKPRRQQLIEALVAVLEQLKAKGLRHNDLHLDNIIGASGKLYLVDLHKSHLKKNFATADDVSNVSHALAMVYDSLEERRRHGFLTVTGGLPCGRKWSRNWCVSGSAGSQERRTGRSGRRRCLLPPGTACQSGLWKRRRRVNILLPSRRIAK